MPLDYCDRVWDCGKCADLLDRFPPPRNLFTFRVYHGQGSKGSSITVWETSKPMKFTRADPDTDTCDLIPDKAVSQSASLQ